jgi:hypothetical protein
MKLRVPPYRVPDPTRFGTVEWVRIQGETESRLEEYLRDWDPGTNLRVGARLHVDGAGARDDAGLTGDSDVRLAIGWQSRLTSIVGGELGPPLPTDASRMSIDMIIPGREVGGLVEIDLSVVVARSNEPGQFVAHRAGSILWREVRKLGLEGDNTRFPVAIVDFAGLAGRNPRSSWYFDWDPQDMSLPVLGGMQLLVNAGHPVVSSAVTTGAEFEGARYVRDAMKLDIARTLIAGALSSSDFSLDVTYEEDSIGAALQGLVRIVFPKRGIDELRIRQNRNPADIEADLQAFLGLFYQPDSEA